MQQPVRYLRPITHGEFQQAAAKHSKSEHTLVNVLDEYVADSIPLQLGHNLVANRSRSSPSCISNDSDNDYII